MQNPNLMSKFFRTVRDKQLGTTIPVESKSQEHMRILHSVLLFNENCVTIWSNFSDDLSMEHVL